MKTNEIQPGGHKLLTLEIAALGLAAIIAAQSLIQGGLCTLIPSARNEQLNAAGTAVHDDIEDAIEDMLLHD
ncbi:hypothetical protein [Ochrobactrum sp. Marseille-Q0166]|uniref:hypothetical protein n=1 Tax=Ochrobactrum sp. Marseille-Q0166 TaxID=2761105 RepID=UPI0016557EF9|nr:hypothetical protein [Ochrobactrum sp. Marseille-Q0166]MBC8718951.1 hypothetical protein [Ochrobactrum sp. Marseille-Q0166]